MKSQLSVIVPVRNEAECIIPFYYELLKHLPDGFELIWVDDCSEDETLSEIESIAKYSETIKCITLKKTYGKDAAVMAGLDFATGDYIVVMNGDLQHPPAVVNILINQLENGYDIVNTNIDNKARVNFIQKWTMDLYYTIIEKWKVRNEISDLTQLRAFKKSVVNDILFIKEKHFFPENYFNWSSYQMTTIPYQNRKTENKHIKYTASHLIETTRKSIAGSMPGFVKTLLIFGATICVASLCFIFMFMMEYYKGNQVQTGALSLTSLLFAGGLQIFVYSSYKQKIKSELFRLCRSHQYIIKNIIDSDKFLSEYNYLRTGKQNELAES
jgi:glycosyltransferase involved in cell wall biosynthesis